jgi:hypothetical protein
MAYIVVSSGVKTFLVDYLPSKHYANSASITCIQLQSSTPSYKVVDQTLLPVSRRGRVFKRITLTVHGA